ncbi:MAG: acyl-CoA synthetase [Myxococcota bacterium]|nr:acyl-CoA synthetase [Myxococcota bacterium]
MEFDLARVNEAVAAAVPDREALIFRDRRFTYAELAERSRRLAAVLAGHGLGAHRERDSLGGHESGQDHLAIYAYNGNEWVESMLGAFKARVAPLNVNYRYVEEELTYLLNNSGAGAIAYHAEFAPTLAKVLPSLERKPLLLQIDDGSGEALLDGALDYEKALAGADPSSEALPETSPDDLYILYTGGTTGMPKGVLWRSADIFVSAMGGRNPAREEWQSLEEVVENAKAAGGMRLLVGPPMMHGAAQWASFTALSAGNTVVFGNESRRMEPQDFWGTIEREKVATALIVGDAFAKPLVEDLEKRSYDTSSMVALVSGGAPLSTAHKEAFIDKLGIMVLDAIGSSETGSQGANPATKGNVSTGKFVPGPGACVVSAELDRKLEPGDEEMGWFAQTGRVPLGYLGDAEKTAKTFPVIDGTRYSVPGDRARYTPEGVIDVLGRDSVTINSGGEKIFAEEVENALKLHPDVYDAVCCGRPSERWGQEVVAIVRLRDGATAGEADLSEEAARHIARYKLPKLYVFRDEIVRSPSGKADYRWAKEQAEKG